MAAKGVPVRLKTLYVRFYKSFNYDYLRKSHVDAVPDPWDKVGDTDLFFPFIRVPLEPDITTVVGANESGKSQLLGAIKSLLTGEDIQNPHDFPELDDPDWHYSDGILTGVQTIASALRAMRRDEQGD